MHTGPWQYADSVGAVTLEMQRGSTVSAEPIVLHVARALAIEAYSFVLYVEDKDTAITQVVKRLVAGWVGTVIDHGYSPLGSTGLGGSAVTCTVASRGRLDKERKRGEGTVRNFY